MSRADEFAEEACAAGRRARLLPAHSPQEEEVEDTALRPRRVMVSPRLSKMFDFAGADGHGHSSLDFKKIGAGVRPPEAAARRRPAPLRLHA